MDTRVVVILSISSLIALGAAGCSAPESLGGQLDTVESEPLGMVQLTTEGAIDWIHWGLSNERSVTRKSNVAPSLSDVRTVVRDETIGDGTLHQYVDNHVRFSWSDGTPTQASSETATGIFIVGVGRGFALSAPADEQPRTLRVYLSGFLADLDLTARLSDGSAREYHQVVAKSTTAQRSFRRFTFVYHASTPGQTLEVEWVDAKDYGGGGNVTIQAATLE